MRGGSNPVAPAGSPSPKILAASWPPMCSTAHSCANPDANHGCAGGGVFACVEGVHLHGGGGVFACVEGVRVHGGGGVFACVER
eukprot:3829276-Pyramimonas_sp.AAC.2